MLAGPYLEELVKYMELMKVKSFLRNVNRVLYMSFDRFLLAVESRDLSQAYKSVFFSKVVSFLAVIKEFRYLKDSPRTH